MRETITGLDVQNSTRKLVAFLQRWSTLSLESTEHLNSNPDGLVGRQPPYPGIVTWKLAQFAIGRPQVAADTRIVANIHENSMQNGGTYQALMTEIVLSDLEQLTAAHESTDASCSPML
jgi:hypothetical protein